MTFKDLPQSIQDELIKRHSHADILNDSDPEQIVYKEQDVVDLLEMYIIPFNEMLKMATPEKWIEFYNEVRDLP